jgi:Asp/Glu/hydantoin racemase
MRIRLVNPNTTASMTALIAEAARSVAGAGVHVDAVSPSMGPSSIESHYDEALAVPGILAEVARSMPGTKTQQMAATAAISVAQTALRFTPLV